MRPNRILEAAVLGAFLCAGLLSLGLLLSKGAMDVKGMDRTVTVKGLSEREAPANVVIWPITFSAADNELTNLYAVIEREAGLIRDFLKENGFAEEDISASPPAIIDFQAQGYGDPDKVKFRYSAKSTLSVYSGKVDAVRETMKKLVELGKRGIVMVGEDYQSKTQFLFTKLNDVKPEMIEEATKNAREVAEKFAKDSHSRLGKIKRAQQGQFTISDRDSNTPHVKKIRVVSTLEYYLSD